MNREKVVFIVGPTGSGKSEIALRLADQMSCGLISIDAMQVYKGMDIVTDKPGRDVLAKYPHELVSVIAASREYDVAKYVKAAAAAIERVLKKKRTPVFVGGTGLYIRSLIHGIFAGPSKDSKVRLRLEARAISEGSAALHRELQEVDPAAAAKISANDARRIIRALEVYQLSQSPISKLQKTRHGIADRYDVRVFGIRRDREDLYRRIDQRVERMVQRGLVKEVAGLLKKRLGRTARACIGISEIEGYLKGEYLLPEAVRLIQRNTRRYAKRQMTWFRREPGMEWIDASPDTDATELARRIELRLA
jgi:tRNA dimethylallyltransferase